jgi:hypothetical protein
MKKMYKLRKIKLKIKTIKPNIDIRTPKYLNSVNTTLSYSIKYNKNLEDSCLG